MTDFDVLFWDNVRNILKAKKIQQQTLCLECGFNLDSFKHKISKNGAVSLNEAFKIANYLNVTIDSLCGNKALPDDMQKAVTGLLLLTPEQRAPIMAVTDGQIQYWTKIFKAEN